MASPPPRAIPSLSKLDLVIETARLKLRPWRIEDAEDIWPIVSDPEFPKFMSWHAHRDIEETREWIDRCAQVVSTNQEV